MRPVSASSRPLATWPASPRASPSCETRAWTGTPVLDGRASGTRSARSSTATRRCWPPWLAAEGRARGSAQQRAGDDHPLDLVGALVDLGDLGVAHHPLDREVLG